MKRYFIITYGCQMNVHESEKIAGILQNMGYAESLVKEEADIIVINTCAFIEDAKKESIDNILDIAWLKENGNLKGIIVTGCLAERYREEIMKEFTEVDCVLGTGSVHSIVKAIEEIEKGNKYQEYGDKNTVMLGGDRIITTGDAFAYLKISEGCNNRCTYCSIPNIRGKFRSRPMDEIITEAKELTEMGISELIVIGQDTTAYGIDLYGKYELATLLRRLSDETDVKWLRILYCYPDKITPELINEFKTNEKLIKYIDIPIQHISDRVLKKMNRRGDGALIRSVMKELRKIDGMAIRSTAIVGFPTETDEEFNELCEFIKEAEFDRFGAFTYSREEETPAYNFDGQIDDQVKQDRYDILMREQYYISENQAKNEVGKVYSVIYEGYDPILGKHRGRNYKNAPDIDGMIFFDIKKKHQIGEFVNVKITDYDEECYDLIGKEI